MEVKLTRVLGTILVIVMIALSGCSVLGSGGSCGPGETKIAQANDSADTVSITGEVVEAENSSFLVEDGSGTAFIPNTQAGVSPGDCLTVDGQPTASFTKQDADVVIVPDEITKQ